MKDQRYLTVEDFKNHIPGVYDGVHGEWIPEDIYHGSCMLSRSVIVRAKTLSPAHTHHYIGNGIPRTSALMTGSAIHAAILEPERYAEEYAVPPTGSRSTVEGREEWWGFCKWAGYEVRVEEMTKATKASPARPKKCSIHPQPGCKTILGYDPESGLLTRGAADAVEGIAQGVRNKPTIQAILQGNGVREATYVAEVDGEMVRVRADVVNDRGGRLVVVDLKSAISARKDDFCRAIGRDSLHMQGGVYSHVVECATGMQVSGFYFVVFEKEPPYACGVYELDQSERDAGLRDCRAGIQTIKQCTSTGVWPDWSDSIEVVGRPLYMRDKN